MTKDFTAVLLMWCFLLAPFSSCYWQFAHYMPIPSKVLLLFWRMSYTHQKTLKLDQNSLLSSWPSFFYQSFHTHPRYVIRPQSFCVIKVNLNWLWRSSVRGKKGAWHMLSLPFDVSWLTLIWDSNGVSVSKWVCLFVHSQERVRPLLTYHPLSQVSGGLWC